MLFHPKYIFSLNRFGTRMNLFIMPYRNYKFIASYTTVPLFLPHTGDWLLTEQFLVICKRRILGQVSLALRPGRLERDIGHAVEDVVHGFDVPFTECLAFLFLPLGQEEDAVVEDVLPVGRRDGIPDFFILKHEVCFPVVRKGVGDFIMRWVEGGQIWRRKTNCQRGERLFVMSVYHWLRCKILYHEKACTETYS